MSPNTVQVLLDISSCLKPEYNVCVYYCSIHHVVNLHQGKVTVEVKLSS